MVGITPTIFLPYQIKWMEDKSDIKIVEKSRRIGLTWAEAAEDCLLAATDTGMDCWYIGYNKDMAVEFINDCSYWCKLFQLAAEPVEKKILKDVNKDIQIYRIKFASGHRITALSSRPANLRGKQGKIIIDEAAFHDDLDGLVTAAIAMLIWGGSVVIISTHNGADNYFNILVEESRSGGNDYSLHRITFDDAINDGLYKRVALKRQLKWSEEGQTAWQAKIRSKYKDPDQELDCNPAQSGGVFLPRHLITACMETREIFKFQCDNEFSNKPEHEREAITDAWCRDYLTGAFKLLTPKPSCYVGVDFGRSGDLSVFLPGQEMPDLTLDCPFVIELRNVPFQNQAQIMFFLCDGLPNFCGAALDARGNGQFLAETTAQRYGEYRIIQVMLSIQWYRDNMPKYKMRFENKSIILPDSPDLIDDHRALRMVDGVAKLSTTKNKGRDGGQRHGDGAIAGAMLDFACRELNGMSALPQVMSTGQSQIIETISNAYYTPVNGSLQ